MSARAKFGPGKYKMRGGRDAVVVAVAKGVAIGYVDSDPSETRSWDARTGRHSSRQISGLDLIHPSDKRKKTTPIRVELWATIERGMSIDPYIVTARYYSRAEALRSMGAYCIAVVRISIDCMEGDGLDGLSDGGEE